MIVHKNKDHIQIDLNKTHEILSWSVQNGGFVKGQKILWDKVQDKDLKRTTSVQKYVEKRRENLDFFSDITFLTSANIDHYVYKTYSKEFDASIVSTVGMGNRLRVGDPGTYYLSMGDVGTINIFIQVNKPLSDGAKVEALSIITEARTAAVIDSEIESIKTGLRATGTGTDCIGIATEIKKEAENEIIFCGKHTKLGEVLGELTYSAIKLGIKRWKGEYNENKNHICDRRGKFWKNSVCS